MAKYYSGITTGTTLDSMLASGSEFGIFPSQDIDCQDISTSGIAHIIGGIKDTSGDMGNSGQVLSSTGSGLNWINPGDANVSSASNVGTNDASSTDATHYLAFVSSTSGNNPVRIDTGLTYNPSSNILTVGTISATNIQGTLAAGGAVPSGGIILWSGAADAIPSGFVLCDGNNSTPDLRNRFVVGANTSTGDTTYPGLSVNATGGSADATLVSHSHTINNHTHSVNGTTGDDTHNHTIQSSSSIGSGTRVTSQNSTGNTASTTNDTHSHSFSATTGDPSDRGTNSQGSSATNENLPPYYALCYIMKT